MRRGRLRGCEVPCFEKLSTPLLPDPHLSLLHLLNPPLIPLLFDPHLSLLLFGQPEIPFLLYPLRFNLLILRLWSLLLWGARLSLVIFHMDSCKKVMIAQDAFCAEARWPTLLICINDHQCAYDNHTENRWGRRQRMRVTADKANEKTRRIEKPYR